MIGRGVKRESYRVVGWCVLLMMVLVSCGQPPATQTRVGEAPVDEIESAEGEESPEYGKAESGVLRLPVRLPPIVERIIGRQAGSATAEGIAFDSTEELWIIERPRPAEGTDPNAPGFPTLLASVSQQELPAESPYDCLEEDECWVPMPLTHTDVQADVHGPLSSVTVIQSYENPYENTIEAKYLFPLPHDAAIHEFVMTLGERRIRGIVRERQEAERIYAAAKAQGHTASLLTQERPNIFTQLVANIEPGGQVDVEISYFHTLAFENGWYEFVFPMVVGPRFNPPNWSDPVEATARGTSSSSGSTAVEYLQPHERSGHDVAVQVRVDAGVPIRDIHSVNHVIDRRASNTGKNLEVVRLSENKSIPNRDFVLRWKVSAEHVQPALFTSGDDESGFFHLTLVPPDDEHGYERQPVEFIFVLDTSGSMQGWPLAKAKAAMSHALGQLQKGDTFKILNFSNGLNELAELPLAATPANIRKGLEHVDALTAGGGTMMLPAIQAALTYPSDAKRLRVISFMTDGYIGNEDQIFQAIHADRGDARVFSFGVGSSVNRHLMEGMARIGRGAVAYVSPREEAGQAVDLFYQRICRPGLMDVEIDWGRRNVTDVFPSRVPDLFAGRAVTIVGRYRGDRGDEITLRGRIAGKKHSIDVAFDLNSATRHESVAQVWARRQISELADERARYDSEDPSFTELAQSIEDLALEHGLVSDYTAFVAVDSQSKTGDGNPQTVPVAVPVPEGVNYDTTVKKGEGHP